MEKTIVITTEEMRRMLDERPEMSPATRRVIETGQAAFKTADGKIYRAPLTAVDDGPTHRVGGLAALRTKETPWN